MDAYFAMQFTLTRSLSPSGSVYRWSPPKMTFALMAGTKPGAEMIVPISAVWSVRGCQLLCGREGGREGGRREYRRIA